MDLRIGHGIDIHKLSPNLPLVLGGIKIKSDIGIEGHSDGDVVLHALTDAFLGALALGDIGTFFSSSDPKWENANSNIFLNYSINHLLKAQYSICNVDINIILQRPILISYIPKIKKNLSELLTTKINNISVKATTTDKLGFIGNSSGIMSTATVLVKKNES